MREKMQYTLTQSSLLAGLSEQHFLETVYVSIAVSELCCRAVLKPETFCFCFCFETGWHRRRL